MQVLSVKTYSFSELSEAAKQVAARNFHANSEFAEEFDEVIETGIANIKETLLELEIDVESWLFSKDLGPLAIRLRAVRDGKSQALFLTEDGLSHQVCGFFMPIKGTTESFTTAIEKLKDIARTVIEASQAYTIEYVAEQLSTNENLRFLGDGIWLGMDDLCPARDKEHHRLIGRERKLTAEVHWLERSFRERGFSIHIDTEPLYGEAPGSYYKFLEVRVGAHSTRVSLGVGNFMDEKLMNHGVKQELPVDTVREALRCSFERFLYDEDPAKVTLRTLIREAEQR